MNVHSRRSIDRTIFILIEIGKRRINKPKNALEQQAHRLKNTSDAVLQDDT